MFGRTVLAVALVSVAGAAHAGEKPLYQAAPAWIAPVPAIDFAKLVDSDPILIVFDQQQRVQDGQVWTYVDQATRVASTQVMGEIGQVSLPWQPDSGDLIVHRAEIIRGVEHIDLIAKGQQFQVLRREEQLEQYQLNGTLTATLSVEGLRVGDVVRMTYSITSKDKALHGNVQAMLSLLGDPARAKFARARLSWPVGTDLKWRTYAEGLAPKPVKQGGFNEIDLALPLAKQPELPADAPVRFQRLPILEASSFADWNSVSRVMAPLYKVDGLVAPGSPLAGEVAKIVAKSSDPRVRAALALQLVQDEVRYLFKGMDGGNYMPQSPADTWSLRYGDCKAKTLLLLAILHEMGIESEPVLANSTLGDQVPQRLPSAAAFDHVIVRATVNGKALWLDGTGSGSRLADLDDTPPFRNVLPLRVQGTGLMPLPIRAAGRPMVEAAVEIDQSAGLGLPALFTATFTARGQLGQVIHSASSQANKEQLSQMVQSTIAPMLGDPSVGERSVSYDAETATTTIKASGIVSPTFRQTEGRYRMPLDKTITMLGFNPDRSRPAWKDIPVATDGPGTFVYKLRVHLPGKGTGFALEGDQALPSAIAGVNTVRRTSLQDGWVTLEDRIENVAAEIAPADIAAARAQVALAKTRLLEAVAPENFPARWQVVTEARRNGSFAPILAAYAKVIGDDPEDATGYTNRANFLGGVWDWKGAIADIDQAIRLAPTADLYFWRARMKLALRDDAGALADTQAGLDLDPGSASGLNQLASLRFRKGQKDEALAAVSGRIAQGGKEKLGFVTLQAELLGEAGRIDEGVAALDAAIKSNPGKADLLNSRCWLKGTMNVMLDTALKDCTRAIEIAEQPAAIYDSRAMVYFRMGRMDDALADLNAALEVSPNQGASLYLRGVIRKHMGDKAGDTDLAGARMMWPRVDEDYARYGIKP